MVAKYFEFNVDKNMLFVYCFNGTILRKTCFYSFWNIWNSIWNNGNVANDITLEGHPLARESPSAHQTPCMSTSKGPSRWYQKQPSDLTFLSSVLRLKVIPFFPHVRSYKLLLLQESLGFLCRTCAPCGHVLHSIVALSADVIITDYVTISKWITVVR